MSGDGPGSLINAVGSPIQLVVNRQPVVHQQAGQTVRVRATPAALGGDAERIEEPQDGIYAGAIPVLVVVVNQAEHHFGLVPEFQVPKRPKVRGI